MTFDSAFMPEGKDNEQQQAAAQELMLALVGQDAEKNRNIANVKSDSVQTEVGAVTGRDSYIVQPRERVVATFGRTRVANKQGKQVIETPALLEPVPHQLDTPKTTDAFVKGTPQFDIDGEFRKLRTIEDPSDREQAAQLLYMNMGQQSRTAHDRIQAIAKQRSGVNDAQMALDQNIALDNAAVQAGKISPGTITYQTEAARRVYQQSLTASNALETDLIRKDPDIQKVNEYRTLLAREFTQIDRAQAKEADRESKLPVLTDARLQNAKFALGVEDTNTKSLSRTVGNTLLKDKALQTVLDADKESIPRLLVHPDMKVRQYAYNIIDGFERQNLGLSKTDELPGYMQQLKKLVADRESLMSPEQRKELTKPTSEFSRAIGEKSKTEAKEVHLYKSTLFAIEKTAQLKYQRMDLWSFDNAQFKTIIDSVKVNTPSKDGKPAGVLMSNGIDAIMKAEIKNQDGTLMSPEAKINSLVNSVTLSMQNDQGSAILPSVQNYLQQFAAQVRNEAMQSFVRSKMRLGQPLDSREFMYDDSGITFRR